MGEVLVKAGTWIRLAVDDVIRSLEPGDALEPGQEWRSRHAGAAFAGSWIGSK